LVSNWNFKGISKVEDSQFKMIEKEKGNTHNQFINKKFVFRGNSKRITQN